MPEPSDRQAEFFKARTRYVAYGGARGGGKSWAVRWKAVLLGLKYPGIRMLLLRKTYPELNENHLLPLLKMLKGIATYKDTDKSFTFPNGSRLKLGYCDAEKDVLQYQGQEYDIIFIDEATQFTEWQFSNLCACNRGTNDFPKRVYLTCNPGGVGHGWVKRLFIDREYREGENADDYQFIAAKVYDNKALLELDPGYVDNLKRLPDDLKRAWLEGDWDIFAGQYFTEFRRDRHVIEPFSIPEEWKRYAAFDYGLDMFACLWAAFDNFGNCYIYREVCESDLIVSAAAERIKSAKDNVHCIFAPSDMWGRTVDRGKSRAEMFADAGVYLHKVTVKSRVDGWLNLREWLGSDKIKIFSTCKELIRCLPMLQHDPNKPDDCATSPHEFTHAPDALRYLLCGRPAPHIEDKYKAERDIDEAFALFGI